MTRHTTIAATLAALAAACGGTGSSESSGNANPPGPGAAQVTRGTITSVSAGGLVVNGIAFSTSATTKVRIEKAERPEGELRRGMVVRVEGSHRNGQGQATGIEFEDHVRGRVRSRTSTSDDTSVDVGGRRVHVEDSTRVVDDGGVDLTPGDIGPDDRVRVSGYADDRGNFRATSVERQARGSSDDSFESKGYVYALNAGRSAFTLVPRPGATTGVSVTLATGVTLAAAIVEGSFVEVHSPGSLSAGGGVVADRVQLEDSGLGGQGSEVEVEGIVTSGTAADFVAAGQRVTTSASTRWEFGTDDDLAPGVKVEAEGHLDAAGTLVAEKVSYRDSLRIQGIAAGDLVDGSGIVTVLGKAVRINDTLTRKDDPYMAGQIYEFRGMPATSTPGVDVLATRLKRTSSGGGGSLPFIQAVVTSASAATEQLTLLGLDISTAGATYQSHGQGDTGGSIGRDPFFARVSVGATVVKAKFEASYTGGPGTAREVELQDEPSPHR